MKEASNSNSAGAEPKLYDSDNVGIVSNNII